MAWSVADWTDNPDWAAVQNINDFIAAVNERHRALGNGADYMAAKNAGDDVQDHAWWESLQEWVETHYASFVVSHDAGVARGAGHFDGESAIAKYGSLAELFAAAGLGPNENWRRYVDAPESEGGTVQWGKIQAGDIIGPWLFDDLKRVLAVLVWTEGSGAWVDDGITPVYNEGYGTSEDSYAEATSVAHADWDSGANEDTTLAATPQMAWSGVNFAEYSAYFWRWAAWGQAGGLSTVCKRDVEWYALPVDDGYDEFQSKADDRANGLGALTKDVLNLFSTNTGTTDATVTSAERLGSLASYATDSAPGVDEARFDGWKLSVPNDIPVCVVRWDIAGGFTYT